jgi:hypothetical protein
LSREDPLMPPAGAPPPPTPPQAPVNTFGDTLGKTVAGHGGKLAGAVAPHGLAATSGFTGSIVAQTVVVDLSAGTLTAFWDDQTVSTHLESGEERLHRNRPDSSGDNNVFSLPTM